MDNPVLRGTLTIAVAGASLIAITAIVSPAPNIQARTVALRSVDSADSPLGDGTALVMGPSGFATPPPSYVATADSLFLQPHDFTGTPEATFLPQDPFPVSPLTLTTDTTLAHDQQFLDADIQDQIAGGHVDAANPVVVFGWSQSSTVSSLTMSQLASQGVPSEDVHFVLVGDPNAPNGGVAERFDVPAGTSPSLPGLDITFNGATPDDLYPTDIYTIEYDGYADFPQYPIDPISDLNDFFGLILAHGLYLGLTPEQIASAQPLPTSAADTLTDYYIIPNPQLPLLEPLELLPVVGQPLYDLLEPDTRILVDLGYGSITEGWSQGYANVPTTFGLFPTNLPLPEVIAALGNGLQRGVIDALNQLLSPDNYKLTAFLDNPALSTLVKVASASGFDVNGSSQYLLSSLGAYLGFPTSDATLTSSPIAIVDDLAGTVSGDYAALGQVVRTVTAVVFDLPLYDESIITDQLDTGNLLGAIGDPIAADTALVPFVLTFGALAPVVEAALGTLGNLVDLFT
ncbi:PE-PPE domain-containing protein [Mycobacterium sp.]|uniref:PE-PPE domain-containing protein n=1 Tax=Mycobacterium sp. TaxID=1785 RepID=UPI0031E2C085